MTYTYFITLIYDSTKIKQCPMFRRFSRNFLQIFTINGKWQAVLLCKFMQNFGG